MKKKLFSLLIALCAVVTLAFAGCGKNLVVLNGADGSVESVVIVVDDSVMELNETTTLAEYLTALDEKGKIDVTLTDSTYGKYITAVNGVEEKTVSATNGYSWMVYTDLTELDGVTYSNASYGTFAYKDKTLNSASWGVSTLPAIEGYTYALSYQEWSY